MTLQGSIARSSILPMHVRTTGGPLFLWGKGHCACLQFQKSWMRLLQPFVCSPVWTCLGSLRKAPRSMLADLRRNLLILLSF